MSRIDGEVGDALAAVAVLTHRNPLVPERVELEKRILASAFVPFGAVWSADDDAGVVDPNLPRLRERVEQLVADVRARLANGAAATTAVAKDYRRAVYYCLSGSRLTSRCSRRGPRSGTNNGSRQEAARAAERRR